MKRIESGLYHGQLSDGRLYSIVRQYVNVWVLVLNGKTIDVAKHKRVLVNAIQCIENEIRGTA